MSIVVPPAVWNAFAAFSVLGAVVFTGLFFIGWLNMEKKDFGLLEYNALGLGGFMFVTGLMVFTGSFIPSFVSRGLVVSVSAAGYGFWGTIIGILLVLLGLLLPCKWGMELEEVTQ